MSETEYSLQKLEEFPLIAFAVDTAAGLTGLSVRQLQRWDQTGFFQPWRADPNRRRPYSRIYSYDNVITLRMIARLREAGVSLASIKPVLPWLASNETANWSERCMFVVGNRVFLTREEAIGGADQAKQQGKLSAIPLGSVVAEVDAAVEQLRRRTPEQIGQVARNRGILRGAPTIAGTRIPTATIAWFHDNGYTLDWILKEFPRLTAEDVRVAVEFERDREVGSPEPVLAHA